MKMFLAALTLISGLVSLVTYPAVAGESASVQQLVPESGQSVVTLEGVPNFRDISCGVEGLARKICKPRTTVDGRKLITSIIYRSEQLETVLDSSRLRSLGVRRIVDFRGDIEKAAAPDPELFSVEAVMLPIFNEEHPDKDIGQQLKARLDQLKLASASQDAQALERVRTDLDVWVGTLKKQMTDSYREMVTNPAALLRFGSFLELAARGETMVFHCVSGKDRTGFAAAILLSGLGVSWKEILADYMLSNATLAEGNIEKIAAIGQMWTEMPGHAGPETLQTIFRVDEEFLTAAFSKIQELYGAGHPPRAGEIASREAIRGFYKTEFGKYGRDLQADLQKALLK